MGRKAKHGLWGKPEYEIWRGMIRRCYEPKGARYHRYGGRGISVCDRWRDKDTGLRNFYDDMGPRPTKAHSIDRINNDGNYEPSNCRWATPKEQSQNQRRSRHGGKGTPAQDITGQKFGRWTVIRRDGNDKHQFALWLCQCECGNTSSVIGISLRAGTSTQCKFCGNKHSAKQ